MFVRWWRTERSLLFLPHPGIGPAQSAERVWLKRGSDVKGEEFVGFAERGGLGSRSERTRQKLEERKRVQCVEIVALEACS